MCVERPKGRVVLSLHTQHARPRTHAHAYAHSTRAHTHAHAHTHTRTHTHAQAWLDLSRKALPTSLLLMSRAFKITQQLQPVAGGAAGSAGDPAAAAAAAAGPPPDLDAEALKQALQV